MVENPEVVNNGTPGWLVPAVVILAIVSIAGLGFAWYDSNQLQMAEQANGQLKDSGAEHRTASRDTGTEAGASRCHQCAATKRP